MAQRFYPLADPMPGEARSRDLFAVSTGETRPPRAGEWYLSGAIIEAYRAPSDLSTPHLIARIYRVTVTHTWETVGGPIA